MVGSNITFSLSHILSNKVEIPPRRLQGGHEREGDPGLLINRRRFDCRRRLCQTAWHLQKTPCKDSTQKWTMKEMWKDPTAYEKNQGENNTSIILILRGLKCFAATKTRRGDSSIFFSLFPASLGR